jgi:hypothetical protein
VIGRILVASVLALLAIPEAVTAADSAVPLVEPTELTRHPEWIGREVAVDDRVKFFQRHEGRGFDEMVLKRADVIFRLPTNLRPERNDEVRSVRVQGILKHEDGQFVCDVTAMTALPRDLARLDQGVASLPPTDFERRAAWARWAERRARAFKLETAEDKELLARARALRAEAFQIEADRAEPGDWPRLARKGREEQVPEPGPSALAHRAFQARLSQAKTADEVRALTKDIEAFFPKAKVPGERVPFQVGRAYDDNPSDTYRGAAETVRAALDRKLWADAQQKSLELQAVAAKAEGREGGLRALAQQAKVLLPDRPEVATQWENSDLEAASARAESLRKDDAEAVAAAFEKRGQPDRARDVRRRWLAGQRERLSPSDAEGRVLLAKQYRDQGDEATAVDLVMEALQVDPQYRDAENALRSMGYKKIGEEWVKSGSARPEADRGEPDAGAGGEVLRGLTKAQVRAKLGKPDQVVRSASQGAVLEQWIYRGQKTQYINFLRRPHMTQPTVEAYYSLGNR